MGMSDLIHISILWVVVGAIWTYYSDKRAYNDGMLDAIVMHNRGELTYTTYTDAEGVEMIEMKVDKYEN